MCLDALKTTMRAHGVIITPKDRALIELVAIGAGRSAVARGRGPVKPFNGATWTDYATISWLDRAPVAAGARPGKPAAPNQPQGRQAAGEGKISSWELLGFA